MVPCERLRLRQRYLSRSPLRPGPPRWNYGRQVACRCPLTRRCLRVVDLGGLRWHQSKDRHQIIKFLQTSFACAATQLPEWYTWKSERPLHHLVRHRTGRCLSEGIYNTLSGERPFHGRVSRSSMSLLATTLVQTSQPCSSAPKVRKSP